MGRFLYTAWQIIWGAPQTLAGLVVMLANAGRPHFAYHGALVTVWNRPSGLSLGMFVFVGGSPEARSAADVDARLLVHEYGHTIQSLVLGPAYLLVVGLPSLVWANVPALSRRRRERGVSYYSFFTERSANWLGERVLKKPSMGLALID